MSKPFNGVRVGNYRITPLGLLVLGVLVLLTIAAILLAVLRPFGGGTDAVRTSVSTTSVNSATATEPPSSGTDVPGDAGASGGQDGANGLGGESDSSPTPTPSPTPEPRLRTATIRSLGEIAMQQDLLYSVVDGNDFNFQEMFSEIASVMGDADYTVADVEGSLGDTADYSGTPKKMITPSALIGALKDCGVDMLNLANDHALDAGFKGLQATIENCIAADMDYVGAAATKTEKKTPVIKDINGIQVGFLAYTETTVGKADADAQSYGLNLVTKSNAVSDAKAMRKAGADVIVCYVSWGEMLNRRVTDNMKSIAKVLVQAGVDVIVGYNPHVVMPATWFKGKDYAGKTHRTLCLTSAGNFLSDQRSRYADSGVIFQFTIEETSHGVFEIKDPTYIPTYVWRTSASGKKYKYRTLAVGQWLENAPEGMSYSDQTRMRQVWAEQQKIMGKAATIAAE